MKKPQIIIATVLGLASVGLGQLYLSRLEAEVSGGPKVAVLVASKNIPVGSSLKEDFVGVRHVPQAYLEERHVRASDLSKVKGSRVSAGLRSGEALLWSDLSEFSDQTRVLSGLVKQGMRAVALNGRDVDFGGLLRPGDRVDVLLTSGDGEGSTRTLIQNLMVLSVGTNIGREGEVKGRLRGGDVTVSTTVEGAQVLAEARRHGQLSLSLRNTDDNTMVEGLPETTGASLKQAAATAAPATSPSSSSRGRIERVR